MRKKALVVDDSKSIRYKIIKELQEFDLEPIEASTGLEALKVLKQHPDIALITLDLEMPRLSGFETLEKIRDENYPVNVNPETPIILITASDSIQNRIKGFRLGAVHFLSKPFLGITFHRLVKQCLHISDDYNNIKVLVVEDSDVNRRIIRKMLESLGVNVLTADDGKTAITQISEHNDIDLIITDLIMKEMKGDELIRYIREDLSMIDIPIIVLTALSESHIMLELFKIGISDYLVKPFIKEEFLARIDVHLKSIIKSRALESNIIKLHQANEEIVLKQKQLIESEKKNSVLAMAVTANHELNQPLAVLQLSFEMLMADIEEIDLNKSQKNYVQKIENSIDRINKLLKKYRESDNFNFTKYTNEADMVHFEDD